MRACTPWALSPHHTDMRCVGALGNPEVPTIAPSQRHGPRALGTPHESFLYPATQLINHIFSVTVAIRAAIKYDQDADGGWSGYRGEASTSSIRCPSSLSFHLMPLFSTGLPPFSSHEAVQFNQNALTYCQLPWAGTANGANIIPVTAAAAGGYDTSRSPFCRHGCSMMLAFARQPMDSLLGGPYPSEMARTLASAAGPEV